MCRPLRHPEEILKLAGALAEEIAHRWNLEAKVPCLASARAGVGPIFEDTEIG